MGVLYLEAECPHPLVGRRHGEAPGTVDPLLASLGGWSRREPAPIAPWSKEVFETVEEHFSEMDRVVSLLMKPLPP